MPLTPLQIQDLIEELAVGATFFTQLAYHSEGLALWLRLNPSVQAIVTKFEKGYLHELAQLTEEDRTTFQMLLAQHYRVAVNRENQLDAFKCWNGKEDLQRLLTRCPALAEYLDASITPLRPIFVKWIRIADECNSYTAAQFEIVSLKYKLEQKLNLAKDKKYSEEAILEIVLGYLNLQKGILHSHLALIQDDVNYIQSGIQKFTALLNILNVFDNFCECFYTISRAEKTNVEHADQGIKRLAAFINSLELQLAEAQQMVNAALFVRALHDYIRATHWKCGADEPRQQIIYTAKQAYYFQVQKKEVPLLVAKQFNLCKQAINKEISFLEAKAGIEKLITRANQKKEAIKFSENTQRYLGLFEPNIHRLEEELKFTKLEFDQPSIFRKYRVAP